jgi:hypothetical protein
MAKIQLEIDVPTVCVCGNTLEQVSTRSTVIDRKTITVKICHKCADEISRMAYNKGLEYGRKAKD